jgi:hypothetical protein
MLMYNNMGAIGSNTTTYTREYSGLNDDIKASIVSCYSSTPEKPCSVMNGLVRNLSSLNVFPSFGNETPVRLWKDASMQNAAFPTSTAFQNALLPTPAYLRNVSSCVLNNNNSSSFASIFADDISADGHVDDRAQLNEHPCIMDKIGMNKDATLAVEKLRAENETDDNVSFEKLVDEMFQHDQNIEFPDLIKLATESDTKYPV